MRLVSVVFALALASHASAQEAANAPAAPAAAPAAAHAEEAAKPDGVHPGDAAVGATKAATCGACHGADGNSSDKQYPKIAGQHERYIARQLKLFKSGERENPVMLGMSATLSEQDMRDIGAYFATKQAIPGVATDGKISADDPLTWAQRGERLYRGGDTASGIPACMACHGPTGAGNPGPSYPHLGGQHADYTKAKLIAFRTGAIWGKGDNASNVMAQVAKGLSDTDIEALSTYLEGLHRRAGAEATAAKP